MKIIFFSPKVKLLIALVLLPAAALVGTAVGAPGDNVALSGTASQSSTGFGGSASRAIDGNTDGNYANNSVTHNQPPEDGAWWEVDLGAMTPIGRICIWWRTDCCFDRQDDFTLIVLDSSRTEVFHETYPGRPPAPNYCRDISPAVTGRILRLEARVPRIGDGSFSLAEVQVFEADPTVVVVDSEAISGFELSVTAAIAGGGSLEYVNVIQKGLYWWNGRGNCSGTEVRHSAKIKLRGTAASPTKLLHDSCHILQEPVYNVVHDETYLYFFSDGQLMRKAVNALLSDAAMTVSTSPETPTLPNESSTYLELVGDRLYWGKYTSALDRLVLYRMKTDGSESPERIATFFDVAGAHVKKLKPFTYVNSSGVAIDALAVLLTDGKLYRFRITANSVVLLATGVSDFAIHTISTFVVGGTASTTRIYAAIGIGGGSPVPLGSPTGELRSVNPDNGVSTRIFQSAGMNQVISVTTDSDVSLSGTVSKNIYITENVISCSGGICSVSDARILRHTLPVPDTSGWAPPLGGATNAGGNLRSDDRWLYFLHGTNIRRLRTDAPAVQIDLTADKLEVVQAAQDLNQSARLVANKKTFVRGYAHFTVDTSGVTAPWMPKGTLEGYRGTTLLGKLSPSPVSAGIVTTDGNLDTLRSSLSTNFLFELPDSWVVPGDLRLLMNLNDDGVIFETGTEPNSVSVGSVHFARGIEPCLVISPLHTIAPINSVVPAAILDRAVSVLPIDRNGFGTKYDDNPISKKVFVPRLCWCLPPVKLIEYRPFNLDADDLQLALDSVAWRAFWSRDPSGFDSVHYVGTVHESHPSLFNGRGQHPDRTAVGKAQSLIARMQTGPNGAGGLTLPWLLPWGGFNLAHELGHNWGRNHINQGTACGSQIPDGPYDPYPFNVCNLGPTTGPTAVFGFDSVKQTPILPTAAADLLTYARSTWISIYNWEILFPNRGASALAAAGMAAPAGDLFGPLLLVHAQIDPTANRAQLDPAYCLPPGVADLQRVRESFAAAGRLPADSPFKIRLVDGAGNVLSQTPCVLVSSSDGAQGNTLGLMQFVPFPPATRLFQIVRDHVVLAERLISGHAPTLVLAPPFVDVANETLVLNWHGADADNDYLLFTVQYSDDDGATWTALDADNPNLTMTVSTRSLPGGPAARVRMIATDGVNCAVAVSEPFPLAKHAPELEIAGVREGQRLAFGALAELQGVVQDAEDLNRPRDHLVWNLTGPTPRAGTGVRLPLAELSPGSYAADAQVPDFDGNLATASRFFEVLPLTIPDGPAPVLDGLAHDAAYAHGTFVRIPLGSDKFARAWLVHSGGNLFVSFSDLQLPTAGSIRTVGLRVDADASRDTLGTSGDIGFFVDSDGIPYQEAGTGSGMAVTLSPQLGFTAVIQLGVTGWSAEFRIADSLLGGWDHAAGIMLDHGTPHWPPLANDNQPATWSPAYFGSIAPPAANRPPFAHTGRRQIINATSATTVVLDGTGSFDPDGDPLTFIWAQLSGPPVLLLNTNLATPSFLATPVGAPATLRFRLVVNDGSSDSAPDETEVTLQPTPIQDLPDLPLSSQARLVDGAFQFRMLGAPGSQYSIQASSNLVEWETLYMGTADFYGLMDFVDRDITNHPMRFYRLTPSPTNDNFASSTLLNGASVSVSTANFLATKEPDEPNHFGNAGGKSLWWSWTAPSNGSVTISTIRSNFDTLLAVYVGNSFAALALIAADDDSGGNTTSLVTFSAVAGVTYQIAVDGYNGDSGNIQLNLTMP